MIAYWIWSPRGWLKVLGALDYAGGSVVHIVAGFSSLAYFIQRLKENFLFFFLNEIIFKILSYTILVGPRQLIDFRQTKPTNNFEIFLGTILIWTGWFGLSGIIK